MIGNTQYIDWSNIVATGKDVWKGALEGAKDGALEAIGNDKDVKKAVNDGLKRVTQNKIGTWIMDNIFIVIPATIAAIYGIYKILKRK